jgi:arginase family enzyme
MLFDDPYWLRASDWLARGAAQPDVAIIGVPTSVGSLSPSEAWRTPGRLREVMAGFSPYDGETGTDLTLLSVADLGDWPVTEAELDEMVEIVARHTAGLSRDSRYAFVGGDNAITRPVVSGLAGSRLADVGVLTFDAHHDVRVLDTGPRNGTPIRGLIADGLPGDQIRQIGIHSFANSAPYRRWCDEQGIGIATMADVDAEGIDHVVLRALGELAAGCEWIHVDFDIDVLDRAFAPGCPGARPGGMTPRQLAAAARLCGRHPRVRSADFVEVDPVADRDDVTVMALAGTLLAFLSGAAQLNESEG